MENECEQVVAGYVLWIQRPLATFIGGILKAKRLRVIDPDDIIQETNFEILFGLMKIEFQNLKKFNHWIKKIALNKIKAASRENRLRYRAYNRLCDLSLENRPEYSELRSNEPPVDLIVENGERDAFLSAVLSKFSCSERNFLALHFWDGYSIAEIARLMGISRQAAKDRLTTLLKKLRLYLKRTHPKFEEVIF